jgi:hypothetical protein
MVNIDVRGVWRMGQGGFATWYTTTTLIGMILFIRQTTKLPNTKRVAAAIVMTTVSWLLVAVVPLPWVASVIMDEIFHGNGGPVSWIFGLIVAAVIATASSCAVLANFRQRITGSNIAVLFVLNLSCVCLTFYRIVSQLIAHPPQA